LIKKRTKKIKAKKIAITLLPNDLFSNKVSDFTNQNASAFIENNIIWQFTASLPAFWPYPPHASQRDKHNLHLNKIQQS